MLAAMAEDIVLPTEEPIVWVPSALFHSQRWDEINAHPDEGLAPREMPESVVAAEVW